MKKKLGLLAAFCLVISLLVISGFAAEGGIPDNAVNDGSCELFSASSGDNPEYSGTCGDNLNWTATYNEDDDTYDLDINWDENYDSDYILKPDWGKLPIEKVVSVYIRGKVTVIEERAFAGFSGMTRFEIYEASPYYLLQEIKKDAFKGCDSLSYALGQNVEWNAVNIDETGNQALINVLKDSGKLYGVSCGEDLYWTYGIFDGEPRLTIKFKYNITETAITDASWLEDSEFDASTVTSVAIADYSYQSFASELTGICESAFPKDKFTALETIYLQCRISEDFTLGPGNEAILNCSTSDIGQVGSNAYYYVYNATGAYYDDVIIIKPYDDAADATIPSGWTNKFSGSTLHSLIISEGITALADNAFDGKSFSGDSSISLPVSLESIGANVFGDYSLYGKVTYAGTQEQWDAVKIADGNDALLEKLPQSHGVCGATATWRIDGDTLYIEGTGEVTEYPWYGSSFPFEFTKIVIGEGITGIRSSSAFLNHRDIITSISLPSTFTWNISEFSDFTALKTVNLASGIKSVGIGAFYRCTALESVTIPNSVTTIEYNAFYGCYALESVTIPDSVTTIEHNAFQDCTALESITLPSSATIEHSVFKNCTALTSVTIPGSVKFSTSSSNLFEGCTSLTSVTLGEGLETIPAYTFQNCTALKSITFPSTLKSVGTTAFKGCSSLATVNFNNGLTTINGSAFDGTALTSVTLPATVSSLGSSAFANCSKLTSFTLSDRVTTIPANVFENCTSLTSIVIPDTVTSINDYAFRGCTRLASAQIGPYVRFVGADVFGGCSQLKLKLYSGSYMKTYADAYEIPYEIIGSTDGVGIDKIETAEGTNAEGKPCTVITITLTDGTEQKIYLDEAGAGIDDISSAPGFDTSGRLCTVVTVKLTDGSTETFYIYGDIGGEDDDKPSGSVSFIDVPRGAYYADAVAWAVENGITSGTSATSFSPNAGCTRAQVVTFIWRAMGCPEPVRSTSFSDVGANEYYSKAVAWAVENGITSGTGSGRFDPNGVCTRAQVVTFLYRALNGRSYGGTGFTDVPSGAYYANAVTWAVNNGVTTGTSATSFSPNANCTRAQVVTFLYRAAA